MTDHIGRRLSRIQRDLELSTNEAIGRQDPKMMVRCAELSEELAEAWWRRAAEYGDEDAKLYVANVLNTVDAE